MIPLSAVRWGRVALVLGAVIVAAAALGGAYTAGRTDGARKAENELLKVQLAAAEKRAEDAERIAALERNLREQGERTAAQLDNARRRADRAIATLEEALRAHAEFAATRRPDDVHRVRVDQLDAIEAATRSAPVPAASDAGVRAPGETDRPDDGGNGDRGRGEPTPMGGLRDSP